MASFTVPCPKCPCLAHLGFNSQPEQQKLSQSGSRLNRFQSFGSSFSGSASSGIRCLSRKFQAQHNEKEVRNGKHSLSGPNISADASSISAFMTQVSDLVKLVDSRDIVELQLKQLECELVIRKKEALQPPPATVQCVVAQASPPALLYPTYPLPLTRPPSASTLATPLPSTSSGKTGTSSHPPLKSPMAGTFYRSRAPGDPPFVMPLFVVVP